TNFFLKTPYQKEKNLSFHQIKVKNIKFLYYRRMNLQNLQMNQDSSKLQLKIRKNIRKILKNLNLKLNQTNLQHLQNHYLIMICLLTKQINNLTKMMIY